jgi:hypothetical protein
MLFFIKFFHTLIFFGLSAGNVYVLYSALVNRVTRWTKLAIGAIFVEGFILILNGWRCPLRTWAEALGAPNGSVTDIFLPSWLASRIFAICTPLFLVGSMALIGRRLNDWWTAKRAILP